MSHMSQSPEMHIQQLLDQGKRDHEAGHYMEAVQHFQRAAQQDPDSYDAYQWLARSLAALRRYDEAFSAARRALELNPLLAMPRVVIGAVYLLRDKRLAQAHAEFAKAISTETELAWAWQWLGRSYATQGQFDEAESALQAAIELAPDRSQVYADLGALYLKQKRNSEAIVMLERAIAMAPTDVNTRINLGSAYLSDGRFHEARMEYWRAFRTRASADALCGLTASVHMEYRLFIALTLTALFAVTIAVRSLITLPLLVLTLGYLLWMAACGLRSDSPKTAFLCLLVAIVWGAIYMYSILVGF